METTQHTVSPRIMAIYNAYKAKKEAVDNANAGHYITSGNFKKSSSSSPINIRTETDVTVLVGLVAYMLSETRDNKEAAELLGVEATEVKFCNCKMESWIKDIKTRITQLSIAKETKELEEMHSNIMKIAPTLFEEIQLQEMEAKLNVKKEPAAETEPAKA